jgi:predicted alpha/beta hydrolase family esterase
MQLQMAKTNKKLKQILFAHSGGEQGSQGKGSFDLVSALKAELSNEYKIHCPIIDDPEAPTYEKWKILFSREFNKIEEPIILVGHSLGSSMLLKYLSEENPNTSISGLFLVATPLWGKGGWDVDDFVLQKNFEATLIHISKVCLYHCKNDSIVPFDHLAFYKKAFPNSTVRELNGKDHAFAKGLPELVSDIKEL